jgi:hypothetical protein
MKVDATNLQGPWMGPGLPLYPEIDEICRVYAPALSGTNVYPGWLNQYAPNLKLRDRVQVYVWEPNNFPLSPGYYNCRLVGNYAGLPLYATNCCITAPFSSSSASSRPFFAQGQACCPNGVNSTIHITFHNTVNCGCIEGATAALTYNSNQNFPGAWWNTVTLCLQFYDIILYCDLDGSWTLNINNVLYSCHPTGTCVPLNLTCAFLDVDNQICAGGAAAAFSATITN